MRTWSGLVDILDGDEMLGRAHVDLACEPVGDVIEWWGRLRGAHEFGIDRREVVTLRLPDGREGTVSYAGMDPDDIYHRIEVKGTGPSCI